MKSPKTQFTNFGQDRIGYQVLGDGPIGLVVAAGSVTDVDMKWEILSLEIFITGWPRLHG